MSRKGSVGINFARCFEIHLWETTAYRSRKLCVAIILVSRKIKQTFWFVITPPNLQVSWEGRSKSNLLTASAKCSHTLHSSLASAFSLSRRNAVWFCYQLSPWAWASSSFILTSLLLLNITQCCNVTVMGFVFGCLFLRMLFVVYHNTSNSSQFP